MQLTSSSRTTGRPRDWRNWRLQLRPPPPERCDRNRTLRARKCPFRNHGRSTQVVRSVIAKSKLRRRESAGPARQWSATSLELHRRKIFLGGYFSGVFEVLIWALEPGSQRASCRNRKSALFLARNLDFRILKSILGLSAPPAGRRSCEKYIKRPAAAPIFLNKQFLHIDFVHAKA